MTDNWKRELASIVEQFGAARPSGYAIAEALRASAARDAEPKYGRVYCDRCKNPILGLMIEVAGGVHEHAIHRDCPAPDTALARVAQLEAEVRAARSIIGHFVDPVRHVPKDCSWLTDAHAFLARTEHKP